MVRGFRVYCLGVKGLGFRCLGLKGLGQKFGMYVVRSRVWGFGFRVWILNL